MRKSILFTAMISVAAIATPAAAQYDYQNHGPGYNQGQNIEHELNQIRQQINHMERRGLVSHREARQLRREAEQIDRLADRYRYNGLTQRERRDIQYRIQNLRQQLQFERREGRRENRR